ncbi:hypothetical protein Bca101_078362 [Brassica carinata]
MVRWENSDEGGCGTCLYGEDPLDRKSLTCKIYYSPTEDNLSIGLKKPSARAGENEPTASSLVGGGTKSKEKVVQIVG